MAEVQFRHESASICITRRMGAPKTASMVAWYKGARKIIPQIPNLRQTDWVIKHESADETWIKYELTNNAHERCYVVINRKVPFIG